MAQTNAKDIDERCSKLLIEELPRLTFLMKRHYCAPEFSSLTIQQHRLMACLLGHSASTTEIAAALGVSLPAISRMTHQLIEAGWLKKDFSKEDRRQVRLSLTAKGRTTLLASREGSSAKLHPRLANLSDKKKQTLEEAFEIMRKLTEENED